MKMVPRLCGLFILKRGGNFCVKYYNFMKPLSISILVLLSNLFESLDIIKPKSSNLFNSEVYIIGKSYRGLTSTLENKLISLFTAYAKDDSELLSIPFYAANKNTEIVINKNKYIHNISVVFPLKYVLRHF